jgi:hypothetical protein
MWCGQVATMEAEMQKYKSKVGGADVRLIASLSFFLFGYFSLFLFMRLIVCLFAAVLLEFVVSLFVLSVSVFV